MTRATLRLRERVARPATLLLGGVASADLLLRIVPELIGLGDGLLLPVGTLLASTYLLEWGTIGWLFGWLLFGAVVFQMAPLLYPHRLYEWAHGLPNRLSLSAGAVALGVFLEKFVLAVLDIGTTPLPYDLAAFPFVLGAVLALLLASRVLPAVRWESEFLYSFDEAIYPRESVDTGVFTAQHLLVALLLGALLAETSLLFPLPELLVLAVVGVDVADTRFSTNVPARRDLTERLVQGVTGIWIGPRGLLWFLYVAFSLFTAFFLIVLYVELVNLGALVTRRPLTAAFVGYCLGGTVLLVTVSTVRLAERIPARIHARQQQSDAAARTSGATPPTRDRARVPGFLLPAGLLWMCLEFARPDYSTYLPLAEIPPFALTPPILVGAALAGLLGVVTVVWADRLPTAPLSDYQTAVMSLACLAALGIGVGFATNSATPTAGSMPLHVATSAAVAFGVAWGPYVGYELDPVEGATAPGARLLKGAAWQGALFFVVGFGIMGASILLTGSPPTGTDSPAGAVLTVLFDVLTIPLLVGAVSRAVMAVFYGGDLLDSLGG